MHSLVRIAAVVTLISTGLFPSRSRADDKPAASPAGAVRLFNTDFQLPANTRWREERIMAAPKLKLSVDLGTDKNVTGTMSMLSRELVDIDVLTDATIRLKFVQRDRTNDIDFANNRSRNTTPLPLDGKVVIAERGEDGRWSAKFDGRRRPTPAEGSALNALSYLWIEGIYPDREVAIGETWVVDAKKLKNLFGADFRKPTGAFEFKLARIVEYDGQNCAKITGKGKFRSQTKNLGNTPGGEATPLDAEMDLTIEVHRSIELAMDINVSMKGTLELSNEKDKEALRYKASSPIEFSRRFKKQKR